MLLYDYYYLLTSCEVSIYDIWTSLYSACLHAYLFPRSHQVLICLQNVCDCLLDIFLFHAGQNCWRKKQSQAPLLPADKERNEFHYDPNAKHF